MVSINTTASTQEVIQDDAGALANDGLTYDDPNDNLDVTTGSGTQIDGSQDVALDEAPLKDGGAKELDVADLSGGGGTANQVPKSDGTATAWGDVDHSEVTGVSADQHHAKDHASRHASGGADDIHGDLDLAQFGATEREHGDLSGIGSSDHHAKYTDQEARDAQLVTQTDLIVASLGG